MRRLRRGSPLIISVHGIAMETLLRAIEIADSSTQDKSLFGCSRPWVCACARARERVSVLDFFVCDHIHASWKESPLENLFLHPSQG